MEGQCVRGVYKPSFPCWHIGPWWGGRQAQSSIPATVQGQALFNRKTTLNNVSTEVMRVMVRQSGRTKQKPGRLVLVEAHEELHSSTLFHCQQAWALGKVTLFACRAATSPPVVFQAGLVWVTLLILYQKPHGGASAGWRFFPCAKGRPAVSAHVHHR